MSKSFPRCVHALFTSTVLFGVVSLAAQADDRFSLAVGQHGDLLIFGPKGEKVADLPIPSISQPVTVSGTTSFQVSYGRDVNDKLTAILAPNATQPENLHFNVLTKSIDTDKQAVVTLTFSKGLGSVSVDPGYVGLVQVNSQSVRHRELADDSSTPPSTPSYRPAPSTPDAAPRDLPAPAPRVTTDAAPRDVAPNADGYDHHVAAATDSSSSDSSATISNVSTAGDPQKPLFWSEPVTGPDGSAPHVAANQMKLVEVQGSVSVKMPDGTSHDGSNGMIVPSGATVSTADGSSAAVFMGGVDSARLMPNSDVQVDQHLDGSHKRTTMIDLHKGAVFSRIGHRPGETQDYEVKTPQGVAAARGTDILTAIVGGSTLNGVKFGTIDTYDSNHNFVGRLHGHGGSNVGINTIPHRDDENALLVDILRGLQQFNLKTNAALDRINGHRATPAEVAYYEAALLDAQFVVDVLELKGDHNPLLGEIGSAITVALHDLLPFFTNEATPH